MCSQPLRAPRVTVWHASRSSAYGCRAPDAAPQSSREPAAAFSERGPVSSSSSRRGAMGPPRPRRSSRRSEREPAPIPPAPRLPAAPAVPPPAPPVVADVPAPRLPAAAAFAPVPDAPVPPAPPPREPVPGRPPSPVPVPEAPLLPGSSGRSHRACVHANGDLRHWPGEKIPGGDNFSRGGPVEEQCPRGSPAMEAGAPHRSRSAARTNSTASSAETPRRRTASTYVRAAPAARAEAASAPFTNVPARPRVST